MPTIKIRNCKFAFRCNRQWQELTPTRKSSVRFCNDCSKEVIYCATDAELARAVKRGQCVAVDVDAASGKKRARPGRAGSDSGEERFLGLVLPPQRKEDDSPFD